MYRIQTGTHIKRVYLDDGDEYIELNFNDSTLPARYFSMVEKIESRVKEVDDRNKGIGDNDMKGVLNYFSDVQAPVGEEIDSFFGEGTCMKIWGCDHPSADLCLGTLKQLEPLFEGYANEFNKNMSKYSASRTGNV